MFNLAFSSICFTGHRPNGLHPLGRYDDCEVFQDVRCWLNKVIAGYEEKAYIDAYPAVCGRGQKSPVDFITGGALGVDTWAAQEVIDMGLRLNLYLPFPEMGGNWVKLIDQETLRLHKEYALNMGCCKKICPKFSKYAYLARDEAMVKDSQLVIAVYNGSGKGGTAHTFNYAQKEHKWIHRYDPVTKKEHFYRGYEEITLK